MLSNRLKLRHLKYFISVVNNESFNKAALELSVSQPAVSKTIQELEDILEAELIDRSKSILTITPSGRVFYTHAVQTIHILNVGSTKVRSISGGELQQVRIGVLPTAAAHIIPKLLLKVHKLNIELEIEYSRDKPALLNALKNGDLDLVLARLPDQNQMNGLSFDHIYYDRLVFTVNPGHPLLKSPDLDLKQIVDFLIILPEARAQPRQDAMAFLMSKGIASQITYIEDHSETVCRELAFNTDTIWLVPESVVHTDLELGHLSTLPFDSSITIGSVGLIKVSNREQSPATDLVANRIKEDTQ